MSQEIKYQEDDSGRLWWCNSHGRKATFVQVKPEELRHCCNPKLGGIMLPCDCVDLTDIIELEEENGS